MFRKMLRQKQQLTDEECFEILRTQKRGVLSLLGDSGYPYGVPMNHYYCPEDGKIYFHSGRRGHKVDAAAACSKASFCVYDEGFRREGEWALNIKSVIVFGRIEAVQDRALIYDIARRLSLKFTDDMDYIENEILVSGPGTLMLALTPEHMTGKLVNEA